MTRKLIRGPHKEQVGTLASACAPGIVISQTATMASRGSAGSVRIVVAEFLN